MKNNTKNNIKKKFNLSKKKLIGQPLSILKKINLENFTKITSLSLREKYNDYTEKMKQKEKNKIELFKKEKVMLVIIYNLDKVDKNGFPAIKEVATKAKEKGYTVYGVSASFTDDLILTKEKYNLPFEFLFCDETTLKTIIRANPGVVILDKGVVVQKKNWIDVDELEL